LKKARSVAARRRAVKLTTENATATQRQPADVAMRATFQPRHGAAIALLRLPPAQNPWTLAFASLLKPSPPQLLARGAVITGWERSSR
jgi:hypothetical protein